MLEKMIESEIAKLDRLIDDGFEQGLPMAEMCAAYQALKWALNPDGHAPVSDLPEKPRVKLTVIQGSRK